MFAQSHKKVYINKKARPDLENSTKRAFPMGCCVRVGMESGNVFTCIIYCGFNLNCNRGLGVYPQI